MPTRLSKAFGVRHDALEKQGAFDAFIDVDSLLYLDPHLLGAAGAPELATAKKRFEDHFRVVLRLLTASKVQGDLSWKTAAEHLTFPETPYVALGYTRVGIHGRAIGPILAGQLTGLAKQIIDAGITDLDLFSLLGLLQEGVGPDLVSDMTIAIILPELVAFSGRVAARLKLPTATVAVNGTSVDLPHTVAGQPILMIPAELLRSLPVAHSWSDIDTVASHNAALRKKVNAQIGDTWRVATGRDVKKKELKATLLAHPELLRDLLAQYKGKPATSYDFTADPDGVHLWFDVAEELSHTIPLVLNDVTTKSLPDLVTITTRICDRFKELVENNRLGRVLFNDDGTPRAEKIAQLFFFSLATFYCDANALDISPEADSGVGPVDFKLSNGAARVTIELMLSSNARVIHGLTTQLPAYALAAKADNSILLVIRTGSHQKRLNDLLAAATAAKKAGHKVPAVVIVDARATRSASKIVPRKRRRRHARPHR